MATSKGVVLMDRASYDEIPAPEDGDIGQEIYVDSDTDKPGFRAVARKDAAGVKEWYEERDSFQMGLAASFTAINLGFSEVVPASPIQAVVDLTSYTEVRFVATVKTAGVTGEAYLTVQSDPTDISTRSSMGGPQIDVFPVGRIDSGWFGIPSGAKHNRLVGIAMINGNGTEDPVLLNIVAHFRR